MNPPIDHWLLVCRVCGDQQIVSLGRRSCACRRSSARLTDRGDLFVAGPGRAYVGETALGPWEHVDDARVARPHGVVA